MCDVVRPSARELPLTQANPAGNVFVGPLVTTLQIAAGGDGEGPEDWFFFSGAHIELGRTAVSGVFGEVESRLAQG